MRKQVKYIETRPIFVDLCNAREEAKEVLEMIVSLADGDDIVQRATDLHVATKRLNQTIDYLVLDQT